MSTSFEFLKPEEKRIKNPVISLSIFLGTTLVFLLVLVFTRIYTAKLQNEYKLASIRVENEAQKFIAQARSFLPDASAVENLKAKIDRHNNSIGGKRSCWTRLFNALEEVLPTNSIITAIENPNDAKPVFLAEDRFFRLFISVPDMETANSLYMKISNHKAFDSLSFSPSGAGAQNQRGILIEISFRFKENYA
jgi:hypothetical protein